VQLENASGCLKAGAYGIAAMGAIMGATDVSEKVRAYLRLLRNAEASSSY
jgi:thiamine monophosphate synthase